MSSCYLTAEAGTQKLHTIGQFDFTHPNGRQDVGEIIVYCSAFDSDKDFRGFGGYFKNIPNEINDFDGYYAIMIDNNNENQFMSISFVQSAADCKSGTLLITVDGQSLRVYIHQLKNTNDEAIIPYGGVNLGEIEMKVTLYDSQKIIIGKRDDGGIGANSIFYMLDNFLRTYNITLDNKIVFKNSKNTFAVELGAEGMYKILNIENLSISTEEISTVESAYADGDIITNSKAESRDIEIELEPPKNNIDAAVQTVFSELYKKSAYIQWKTTRWLDDWYSKNWKMHGVVNEINVPRFTDKVSINILLHCSNPFWQGATVAFTCGHGGQVLLGDENPNTYFFRTKSQNTGARINISTNGLMGGIAVLPKRSNFYVGLYTYEDLANKTGRKLLQKMEFTGTYGSLHYSGSIADGVNYDIDITTEFRNKNAIEKITSTNMLDDLTSSSEFLIVNQDVCEIDFNDLFTESLLGYNPYVTVTYTPLFIG